MGSILLGLLAFASAAFAEPGYYGFRRGYLNEVSTERKQVVHELVWIPNNLDEGRALQKKIFDTNLTREFQSKYELKFGVTDAQRNLDAPNRFDELTYDNGVRVTPAEDVVKKRQFGEYMTRRLVEYHLDLYLKTSETTRPVYVLKDSISNVDVQIAGGYQLNLNYSIAANQLQARLKNPKKIDAKIIAEFGGDQFGDGVGNEMIYYVGYPFSKRLWLKTDYKSGQGVLTTALTRGLRYNWSTSLTASRDFIDNSEVGFEDRLILGFSWVN